MRPRRVPSGVLTLLIAAAVVLGVVSVVVVGDAISHEEFAP